MSSFFIPRDRGAPAISGIYCITNTENGKVYVGSAQKIHIRIGLHRSTLRAKTHRNAHLQHAFDKYGEAAFAVTILEEVPESLLIDREQYWIDRFQAADAQSGYNIEPIAGRTAISIATRQKISDFAKERWKNDVAQRERFHQLVLRNQSIEGRAGISERRKGRKWSAEAKSKHSENLKNNEALLSLCRVNAIKKRGIKRSDDEVKKIRLNARGRRPVYQYDLAGKRIASYTSVRHVMREMGFATAHIADCCKGKIKTAYGFKWKYVNG